MHLLDRTREVDTLVELMGEMKQMLERAVATACILCLLGVAGCTSRAMTVTSLPPGAEVSINRRVVGKTPVRVNYTHYGSYRVELRQDRYKTLVRTEHLRPPWYGYDPFSFFADNAIPARINDETYLHYVLEPVPEVGDREGLMKRANMARDGRAIHPETQEEVVVAWGPASPLAQTTDLDAPAQPEAEPATTAFTGPSATPQLELPAELKAPKGITEKPPEATSSTPATSVQPTTTPGETQTATTPATGTTAATPTTPGTTTEPNKTEQPPLPVKRMRRTPQGEILIYDEPMIEDPGKKK